MTVFPERLVRPFLFTMKLLLLRMQPQTTLSET
jgi:hypothetical protein